MPTDRKITAIDKATAQRISAAVVIELTKWAESVGLKVTARGGTFDPPLTYTCKIEFTVQETASGKSVAQVRFEKYAKQVFLEPTDFGKSVELRGRSYTIAGILPSASKRPVIIEDAAKRQFTANEMDIRKALGRTSTITRLGGDTYLEEPSKGVHHDDEPVAAPKAVRQ